MIFAFYAGHHGSFLDMYDVPYARWVCVQRNLVQTAGSHAASSGVGDADSVLSSTHIEVCGGAAGGEPILDITDNVGVVEAERCGFGMVELGHYFVLRWTVGKVDVNVLISLEDNAG